MPGEYESIILYYNLEALYIAGCRANETETLCVVVGLERAGHVVIETLHRRMAVECLHDWLHGCSLIDVNYSAN